MEQDAYCMGQGIQFFLKEAHLAANLTPQNWFWTLHAQLCQILNKIWALDFED